MSKNGTRLELSRRQILAGLGGIGLASAGAGLGTSAYFNDTESFDGNTITAGELDLKVDWQQTYDGPIPGSGGEVGEHPVNAYPDSDGDGVQDLEGIRYSGAGDVDPVFDAAEVPACCDCADSEFYLVYEGESYCIEALEGTDPQTAYDKAGNQSQNDDIQSDKRSTVFLWRNTDTDDVYLFVVNDRRQTEFGGTATYEIEGSPNARWETGDWVVEDDDRNGSDDSYEDPDSSDGVAVGDWVWNGANTDGGVLGPVNDNGSQGDFALRLTPKLNESASKYDELGDLTWISESDVEPLEDLVVLDGDANTPISLESGIDASGSGVGDIVIHSACGIESGDDLSEGVFGDQDSLVQLDDVKPGDSGEITFSLHLCDNPGYLWLTASNFTDLPGETPAPEPTPDEGELAENTMVRIWYDEDCDNQHDDGEQLVFGPGIGGYTGLDGANPATLAAAMDLIGASGPEGGMIPLDGDGDMGWNAGSTSEDRDCLPGETGVCVGFEWWVPTSVGNVIQGDEVRFDLGFYAEQCRNNDGSGSDSGGT